MSKLSLELRAMGLIILYTVLLLITNAVMIWWTGEMVDGWLGTTYIFSLYVGACAVDALCAAIRERKGK